MEWVATSINPEDAQFLATRQFQVVEIARMFRLPPHKIGAKAADLTSTQSVQGQGISEVEQVPGQPRAAMGAAPGGGPARAGAASDDHPGPGFVRIRWKNKIGGHEADEEWAEERRAHNLVGSGHAELVKDKEK